jgi:hypothetical protein
MPTFIEQPLGIPVMSGSTIDLSCKARGFPLPNYQWFVSRNGRSPEKIQGQVRSKLTIRNAMAEHEGQYCCRVQNKHGHSFSHYAEVRVQQTSFEGGDIRPPVIQTHPVNEAVESGETVKLCITADGTKPLKYQWFKNAKLMEGETAAMLTLHNAKFGKTDGAYSCRVSNQHGSAMSTFATVYVIAEIEIIRDLPNTVSVKEGDQLRLEVIIGENPDFPPQYEWWKFSKSENGWNRSSNLLPNEHERFLLISAAEKHHAGSYRCKVTYRGLSKESSICQVQVSGEVTVVKHVICGNLYG